MAPPNGDVENGDVDKEIGRNVGADNNDDLGEYGNLVKYISNYRDGRRSSVASGAGSTYEDAPKKKWYKFGLGKKSSDGSDSFDTPDDWLGTDWKQGLTQHDVDQRRRRTGWNELTTEKENLFVKFLMFFTGPILYGKFLALKVTGASIDIFQLWKSLFSSRQVCETGLISVLLSLFYCLMLLSVGTKKSRLRMSSPV
jgi:magnesium-transporting ATPase (P-type)